MVFFSILDLNHSSFAHCAVFVLVLFGNVIRVQEVIFSLLIFHWNWNEKWSQFELRLSIDVKQ